MTIRIIEEAEIVLTRAEHEQLQREWRAQQQMTVAPSSFETWLRNRRCCEEQARAMESVGQGATSEDFFRHISGKGRA